MKGLIRFAAGKIGHAKQRYWPAQALAQILPKEEWILAIAPALKERFHFANKPTLVLNLKVFGQNFALPAAERHIAK